MMTVEHAAYLAIAVVAAGIVCLFLYDVFLSPGAKQASEDFHIGQQLFEERVPLANRKPRPARQGAERGSR